MLLIRRSSVALSILLVVLLLPAAAYAQAAITGVVKDTSGAVLPGVTVEAASSVLIEKVRSVVSDDTGQYRIVNLPPGTFSITFSLPGFSTVKREGVELTGTFVATVNGDLKVGALEETITVTGETPIVDVQSARVQTTVSKDILAAIPSSRTATGIQALIPGMNTASDVGGASGGTGGGAGNIHGGRGDDSNMQNDGLTTTWQGGSGGGGNNANVAGAQEIVVSTSGGLGESEKGGVTINLIPREGGNSFTGTMFYAGANGAMQGSNYTQALKDKGLSSPQEIISNYDINPMGGGRIIRDRLWFYNTLRIWGAENTVPGMFQNKNAGDPTKWTYDPDTSRPATSDNQNGTAIMRLTWQATPRNKVSVYWSEQWNLGATGSKGGSATSAPESIGKLWYRPSRVQQATWSSPMTSRVLLEAGFGTYEARYRQNGAPREDGTFHPLLFQATEQAGIIPGLSYRAPVRYHHNTIGTHTWRGSISYVTGAHNMKFGYFGGFLNPLQHYWWSHDDGIINYRFRNGVANRITIQGTSPLPGTNRFIQYQRNGWPTAFYAQDQWTTGKLTLQGGVRYDHYLTNTPDQQVGGTLLIPVPIAFPSRSTAGVNWDDITPRMGAAYDLFGNGKTALKFNLGKYPNAVIVQDGDFDLNPLARITVSTTRSWADTDKDYVPDCDLVNPAKNAECGAMADQNFGKNIFSRNYDPALVTGWGTRPYQWDMGASVQQEVLPRVSVNVGYYRRWFGNFYTTDNRKVGPADFDAFSIVVPADSRLPNGGGQTITGLYDLNPAKFGQVDDYRTSSNNFGNQTENWHGVDVGVSARLRSGITIQGGTSTGRRLTDNCEIRAKLPEIGPVNPYCRVEEPFLTQMRGLATYTIPRVAVQVSGTWQSTPGSELLANYDVSTALIKPSLGRDLSGGAANATVDVVGPARLYGDRKNQLDFRIAKILRFGRTRAQIGVDLFNITNTDVVVGYNNGYVPGGAWLTPTSILTARWAKFSAQFDF